MKILVDMNLSPRWVDVLSAHGWEAIHWSNVGEASAPDRVIMDWAGTNGYIVFTHDLDFGAILAATRAQGPSVIQVRTQDVLPDSLQETLITALNEYEELLEGGALIVVDDVRARARILPLRE